MRNKSLIFVLVLSVNILFYFNVPFFIIFAVGYHFFVLLFRLFSFSFYLVIYLAFPFSFLLVFFYISFYIFPCFNSRFNIIFLLSCVCPSVLSLFPCSSFSTCLTLSFFIFVILMSFHDTCSLATKTIHHCYGTVYSCVNAFNYSTIISIICIAEKCEMY